MKQWVETKDGKIVEVDCISKNFVCGREINTSEVKLKYGDTVVLKPEDIIEDDSEEIEDDLAIIFQDLDNLINNFFENTEDMFEERKMNGSSCEPFIRKPDAMVF